MMPVSRDEDISPQSEIVMTFTGTLICKHRKLIKEPVERWISKNILSRCPINSYLVYQAFKVNCMKPLNGPSADIPRNVVNGRSRHWGANSGRMLLGCTARSQTDSNSESTFEDDVLLADRIVTSSLCKPRNPYFLSSHCFDVLSDKTFIFPLLFWHWLVQELRTMAFIFVNSQVWISLKSSCICMCSLRSMRTDLQRIQGTHRLTMATLRKRNKKTALFSFLINS